LVLLAALLHAVWNALLKSGEDRVLVGVLLNLGASALALPVALAVGPPRPESWLYLGLSIVIHNGYFWFLILAYRVGDLSRVYPLARGAAPLLVAGLAYVAAGEVLGGAELAAVAVVSAGIISLALDGGRGRGGSAPLLYALAIALLISAYTVIDGLGVRAAGDVPSYVAWLFLVDGLPFVAVATAVRGRAAFAAWRTSWRAGLLSGALAVSGYGLVIWAMSRAPIPHVSALRETSVVIAALIGTFVLGEPFGARRVAAAAVVTVGIALLLLAGAA
jgi:drug/metabolite transporter (DMT)-like permease